jgi:acyl-CoA reductase-like NAD-dependent aldehyde dehydrogenase
MPTATAATACDETELLGDLEEYFGRNLIGGRWHFPAAPYEYEIRSPVDSRVIAVVPLSSRFDVAAAVSAGRLGIEGPWSDPAERAALLRNFLAQLESRQVEIATLQRAETGLTLADSLRAVEVTLRHIRRLSVEGATRGTVAGVSGHILSWGAPFTEALTSIWGSLSRGNAVVVKPSLRAPLSAVLLGRSAEQSGLPAGVLNVVQGTGDDVGAELIRRRDLAALSVRGNERTVAGARRARTDVPLDVVLAGGNVCVVGPEPREVDRLADHLTALVRMNSAGGVFGLPLLAVHPEAASHVVPAVLDRLAGATAAPLPSDALRGRCLSAVAALTGAGAALTLGAPVPDDVEHRMGWRVPPTVVDLGAPTSPAARAWQETGALGPVLALMTVAQPHELREALRAPRFDHGFAWVRDWTMDLTGLLPHASVMSDPVPTTLDDALAIPPRWTGIRP